MKIILTTLIMLAFTACNVIEHKQSVSSSNSKTAAEPDKVIADESVRQKQAKFAAEDFLKFKKFWNTKVVNNFKETLLDRTNNNADEVYRFFWVSSFDNAVAIRVWRSGDKQFLIVKKVDGEGFEMGKLFYEKSRGLTEEEWFKFTNLLDQTSFWKMPTTDVDQDPMTDGGLYIIEGNKNNQYHEVHRGRGSNSYIEVQHLGKYLLNLTELKAKYP